MLTDSKPDTPESHNPATPEETSVIDAATIFRGRREVWIEHAGVRYRLRITRKNRLILQK